MPIYENFETSEQRDIIFETREVKVSLPLNTNMGRQRADFFSGVHLVAVKPLLIFKGHIS
jgi:hypothetical protein